MELELGFKISKALNDYSSAGLRISKDRAGPLFVSKETDTMFVLTAILKGYKKEHVQIDINKDGTRIAINGERQVQEMVMVNWQMRKKEPEMRGFRKVFNIPEGVNLDKIKARFNEDENVLTISMPKLVKGLIHLKIEEMVEENSLQKEKESLTKENDEIVSDIYPSTEVENGGRGEAEDSEQKENEILPKENDEIVSEIISPKENMINEQVVEEIKDTMQNENKNLANVNVSEISPRKENENGERVFAEAKDSVPKENENLAKDVSPIKENDEIVSEISPSKENENEEQVVDEAEDVASEEITHTESEKRGSESGNYREKDNGEIRQANEKGFKLCVPMIAPTVLLVSIFVFVIQMIRANNASKKKN